MYEQHFGLRERLFPAKLTGAEVFVGPRSAEALAGIKKALRSRDAVIAVSGPVGSGKSTLVAAAIEDLGDAFRTVQIGRLRLQAADMLEFLLEQLGVKKIPNGAMRQFAAIREALAKLEARDTQVVVVIEDAYSCGAEVIAELESLTAADAGDSGGAAIVLMGDERLGELLAHSHLARLAQRVRQRHAVQPLTNAEMRGYLRHRFRQAGGDFDASFETAAAEKINALSGGIPRVAISILEAVMTAAAAADEYPVAAAAVASVARSELGLEGRSRSKPAPAASGAPAANPEDDITAQIEKTRPQMPRLEVQETELPDWDREPTLAQLRPDLDALEKAIAMAQGEASQFGAENVPDLGSDAEAGAKGAGGQHEITLDRAIGQQPPKVRPKTPEEIQRISTQLSQAKSIRDIGDTIAETLFGENIDEIFARVAAADAAQGEEPSSGGATPKQGSAPAPGAGKPKAAAASRHKGDPGEVSDQQDGGLLNRFRRT